MYILPFDCKYLKSEISEVRGNLYPIPHGPEMAAQNVDEQKPLVDSRFTMARVIGDTVMLQLVPTCLTHDLCYASVSSLTCIGRGLLITVY